MTEEERRAVMGSAAPALPKLNSLSRIERVVAVLSGKGGVGKSSVTALLACALTRQGKKVGILDADITGPSIPRLFGLPSGGLRGSPQGILPAATRGGIRVISTNLLLAEETQALIWRGPMISGTIHQFWGDVLWGKLDVLLVDLPPGTGDATLTVMQALPVSAAVMVTTPQALAGMVVQKAYGLLEKLSIPVIGVVENMSYYPCPDTGKVHEIFGPSHAEETARACGAPLSARLPIDPQLAVLADNGQVEQAPIPDELAALAERITQSAVK
jgi:Mrp family chromosome partitioning ATPase